jgi:hypothetical protein
LLGSKLEPKILHSQATAFYSSPLYVRPIAREALLLSQSH